MIANVLWRLTVRSYTDGASEQRIQTAEGQSKKKEEPMLSLLFSSRRRRNDWQEVIIY
jgi:hypothetical protein